MPRRENNNGEATEATTKRVRKNRLMSSTWNTAGNERPQTEKLRACFYFQYGYIKGNVSWKSCFQLFSY